MAAFLAVIFVATASGQKSQANAASLPKYDLQTETKIKGTVEELKLPPKGSEKEVLARFSELRAWFAPVKLTPESLTLDERYAWSVKLNNSMRVALGREHEANMVKSRVERLVNIYPQLLARVQNIYTVDMRYPNGLALTAIGLDVPTDASKPVKASGSKSNTTSKTKHT